MSVIDEQGRLFGRVNLIDAFVVLFVLGLIPMAYGTALLFQPARPRIDSVTRVDISNEERRIVAGGSLLAAKLKIKGTGFNPMLRSDSMDSVSSVSSSASASASKRIPSTGNAAKDNEVLLLSFFFFFSFSLLLLFLCPTTLPTL